MPTVIDGRLPHSGLLTCLKHFRHQVEIVQGNFQVADKVGKNRKKTFSTNGIWSILFITHTHELTIEKLLQANFPYSTLLRRKYLFLK